jgi:UDP-GlcNAc:undecaprenyl-phosphate GlcNAc-1-phosphate transferase
MNSLIWLGGVSLALSLIFTPLFRNFFRFFGFVDQPDNERKIHIRPIPRAGGVAIALSYIASFLIIHYFFGILDQRLTLVFRTLPSVAVIFAVGLIDDLWGLKPWQKLGGQLVACGIACYSGILIMDIVGVHERAWWTIPVTILWLLASTNAFNLVDGLDGLAGGVGLFATLTILIAALLQDNLALAMATVPLVGCLLGFLRYNFAPATVFLGDSGSLAIGFLLGCYGIIWTQKSATLLGMMAPVMALSIPLLDVGLAIVRRFLRRQPIFTADRGHIHHRLLDRGMSPRQAAIALYAICSLVAIFSLLYSQSHSNQIASVIVLVFCAVAWMGIQYLGYAEFTYAGRILFGGDLQRALRLQLDLQTFQRSLESIESSEHCVRLIQDSAPRFGFVVVRMQIAGEVMVGTGDEARLGWEVRVPLGRTDFIELVRDISNPSDGGAAGPFLDALRAGVPDKASAFSEARRGVVSNSEAPVW